MTWSIQVETGDRPVWMVGITPEMIAAAEGNKDRDMVTDSSRSLSEQERHSLKGNLGELVVQTLLTTGNDADRWEYVDEFETDLIRDGDLKLDVKTRDLAASQGQLLVRRRYIHPVCGGAIDMDDNRRCVKCGETEVPYFREEPHSNTYLLVLLPFADGVSAEVPGDVEFAHKMGLVDNDELSEHRVKTTVEDAFPLDFALVVGMASKHKVMASKWLEADWMPDHAHEVHQDDLDDASSLLGWA